ncbi:MAG: type II toxin-antitoxin system RelE/ParE family toxin [Bacteroidetes bacterium]|nr:type II toxin-antitoxin system RelE/ParE family toxin [Bacteroidota bacterium]MDA1120482.1 type II toxin-antitoxin system RelE/ParE family toxin [Bacteroidota bacterium]
MRELSDNPRPFGYRKLKGKETYRIRVGNFRVIYEIIDQKLHVLVISIGHRKKTSL